MRAIRLEGATVDAAALRGLHLAQDLGPGLRKGTPLGPRHLAGLRALAEVHAVALDASDLHEDEAGRRLGAMIGGQGTLAGPPRQSQVRLRAAWRGLLRVAVGALDELNRLPGVGVFTLVDGQAVNAGEEVAGAKVTPVAVPASVIDTAASICAAAPVARVEPFHPLRTLVVVTERLKPRARTAFADAVSRKLGWYGADILGVREVARASDAMGAVYEEARALEAELVLLAGASAIDPLDPAHLELERAGGEVVRRGMPAHPGSMLWLGRLGAASVVGVASCAGFGRSTSLDLLLPFVFAEGGADEEQLVRLGHGGLIESGAGRRFPPYPAPPT